MAIVESLPSPTLNRNNLLALTTPWVRHGALMYKKMKAVAAQEVSCCVYDNPPQKKKNYMQQMHENIPHGSTVRPIRLFISSH